MIYQKCYENSQDYLFKFVLMEHVEEYIGQGWEILGMMQNTATAINSVTSYIMAIEIVR